MEDCFVINIAEYDKSIFKGEAKSAILTSEDGEFSITKDHIPTIAVLKKNGKVVCELADGNKKEFLINATDGGFCIFEKNTLNIFA